MTALAGGCATDTQAPIEQKSPMGSSSASTSSADASGSVRTVPLPERGPVALPANHVVAAGETLHAIAYRYDLDYRDLIRWNQIANPDLIRVGQVLRLQAPPAVAAPVRPSAPTAPPQWEPLPPLNAAESTPRESVAPAANPRGAIAGDERAATPVGAATKIGDKPAAAVNTHDRPVVDATTVGVQAATPVRERADAAATSGSSATERAVTDTGARAADSAQQGAGTATASAAVTTAAAPAAAPAATANAGGLRWSWPAQGKVTPTESSSGAKGIDIRGARGQPVLASAAGTVVYSGSGLRGLGELIIIKHNDTFLSAYAHNETRLVQEGSRVNAGDKIASMGNTDAADYMLHFEIRRNGKPVDPLQYLPGR